MARTWPGLRLLGGVVVTLALTGAASAADRPEAAPEASAAEINRLIGQLGDKDYYVRQKAEAGLTRLGVEAFDALSEATTNEDLEIAARSKRLLQLMQVTWTDKQDKPDVRSILQQYEAADPASRQKLMQALAVLKNGDGVPALCRLARYEKSAILSRYAALTILGRQKDLTPFSKETAEAVRKGTDGSRRVAAQWLSAWLRYGKEPGEMARHWSQITDSEETLLRGTSGQTSTEVVAALLRFEAAWLKKAGRTDDAIASLGRLILLEKGKPESLASLVEWLTEQKDWKAIDSLSERYAIQIAEHPLVLYTLAASQIARGDSAKAEQIAKKALGLFPGKGTEELIRHYVMATALQRLGRFGWAAQEYRHILDNSPIVSDLGLAARVTLAEMLHDQDDDLGAAETIRQFIEAIDAQKKKKMPIESGERLNEIRTRMHYFSACHWKSKGDMAKCREQLEMGLSVDPTDIEILIACYRLPDAKPEFRQKIRDGIKKAADKLRNQIAEDTENAVNYNQFAWLIGNTEGDMDEALECSKRSLELNPETGGYYDTMGRVYFGKGDYENALKSQTKAAELDPHSGQIKRQLELFRKKLEETKKKPEADRK